MLANVVLPGRTAFKVGVPPDVRGGVASLLKVTLFLTSRLGPTNRGIDLNSLERNTIMQMTPRLRVLKLPPRQGTPIGAHFQMPKRILT